jgi:hypothetical protein
MEGQIIRFPLGERALTVSLFAHPDQIDHSFSAPLRDIETIDASAVEAEHTTYYANALMQEYEAGKPASMPCIQNLRFTSLFVRPHNSWCQSNDDNLKALGNGPFPSV